MLAEFLGTLLGTALKAAGPEFFASFVEALTKDKAVIAKPVPELQNEIKNASDPAGILGPKP